MTASATRPAPLVVGRYALYEEIAAGGMATIHLGRLLGPVGFARTVAIKRLHPPYARDPEFVSMFLDEARLAARVQHPNVVATIDVVATNGELFLIMDYVRGESLAKLLRSLHKGQQVPPRIAAAIMCGFLHGLHAAHEAKNERGEPLGLVHRDVSPQNVLVGSDGVARVLDFGIAKAQGRMQTTRDGTIKGKLAYMPPEQLAGKELTRAVDIYAAGVVMWEALTGARLFKGESEPETLVRILRAPVPAPSTVVPSVPKAFDAPLLRALSRDATSRHATAKELALELERCVGIASPSEVGDWVETVVGQVLTAREVKIAEIESNSASLQLSVPEDPGSQSQLVPTAATNTLGTAILPPYRKLSWVAALAGLGVLVLVVAAIVGGKISSPPSAAVASVSPSTQPSTAPTPSAIGRETDPPPALTEPARTEPALTEPALPVPVGSVVRPATTTTPKTTPSTQAPRTKGGCDPPYTVDARGHRHYKRECL